jgi:hypothetical protein
MAAPLRSPIFALALVAGLVFGVTSAQAVSLPIPNSGFETPCSTPPNPPYSFPCNWGGTSGSQVMWDNTLGGSHTGNASLKLESIGTPGIDAISSCVPATGNTTYNLEFWYRTSAAITFIAMGFNTYTTSNCTLSPFGPASSASTNSPNTTDKWTRVQGQSKTDPGVQSVKIVLSFSCLPGACASGLFANFDDVVAQTEPLAVTVASFAARPVAHGVLLRWHTGTEADLLGFHVYRARGHSWRGISSLIAAKGSVSGASYRFLDKTAKRGVSYRYRLKAVNRDGTAAWFGPVRVT